MRMYVPLEYPAAGGRCNWDTDFVLCDAWLKGKKTMIKM